MCAFLTCMFYNIQRYCIIMKRIFLFLLVLQTVLSIKQSIKLKRKLIVPESDDCKDVKCPAVEEPICVRMKHKKPENSTKSLYIALLNKCEMGYMKCHKGLEADVVPMKFCGHKDKSNLGKMKLTRSKRDIKGGDLRVTRARKAMKVVQIVHNNKEKVLQSEEPENKTEIKDVSKLIDNEEPVYEADDIDEEYRFQNYDPIPQDNPEPTGNVETAKLKGNTEKLAQYWQGSYEDHNPKVEYTQPNVKGKKPIIMKHKMFKHPVFKQLGKKKYTSNVFKDKGGNQKLAYGKKLIGHNPDMVTYDQRDEVVNMPDSDAAKPKHFGTESNDQSRQKAEYADDSTNESHVDATDVSLEEDDGIYNGTEQVDLEEYAAECPTVCPARTVMVCARCQHDVYKTFMSVCHLRMFACHHTDEIIELVSRYPCVMSAPYLSQDPPMQPRGILSEPADEDRILRYIHCREQGKLFTDQNHLAKFKLMDPKCDFKDDNTLKHEIYFTDVDYY